MALADGFVHDPTEGNGSDGRTRGGQGALLPPDSFITYVQNHDQIGNRGASKRIADRVSPMQTDFMHFVKFMAPQFPLCFMGGGGGGGAAGPGGGGGPGGGAGGGREGRGGRGQN